VNLFAKMHYRVTKECIMTDKFDIRGTFSRVARLQVGEIVRLVSDFKTTPNGMVRFLAETLPAQETAGVTAGAGATKKEESDDP